MTIVICLKLVWKAGNFLEFYLKAETQFCDWKSPHESDKNYCKLLASMEKRNS